MPEGVRAYCRRTAASNVLDWHTAFGFDCTTVDLAGCTVPTLLVRGEAANAAMVAITDAIGRSLPDRGAHVVAGASHFLIATHARACAELLRTFLDRHARTSG